jgi:hypothetical protein
MLVFLPLIVRELEITAFDVCINKKQVLLFSHPDEDTPRVDPPFSIKSGLKNILSQV